MNINQWKTGFFRRAEEQGFSSPKSACRASFTCELLHGSLGCGARPPRGHPDASMINGGVVGGCPYRDPLGCMDYVH